MLTDSLEDQIRVGRFFFFFSHLSSELGDMNGIVLMDVNVTRDNV